MGTDLTQKSCLTDGMEDGAGASVAGSDTVPGLASESAVPELQAEMPQAEQLPNFRQPFGFEMWSRCWQPL